MGIDSDSLQAIQNSRCRVELIFQWIQCLIIDNIDTGILEIPAPILTRAFQELASGMAAFRDSVKLAYIPFPFPYAQTCDTLLYLHWFVTPFVFVQWVVEPFWVFTLVFIQVFILWTLNFIAIEIENPFGKDANDLDGRQMQSEFNYHLDLLLQPETARTPTLSQMACWEPNPAKKCSLLRDGESYSFNEVWEMGNGVWTQGVGIQCSSSSKGKSFRSTHRRQMSKGSARSKLNDGRSSRRMGSYEGSRTRATMSEVNWGSV